MNRVISTNLIAEMASVALVILALGILGIGAMNTKRYKLRERYTRRPLSVAKGR